MRRHRPLRRAAAPILAILVAVSILPTAGLIADGPGARAATEIRPRITGIKPLSKEVYGYLPYWRLDSGTVDRLQYDLVSTIAFFGIGIKADGSIDTNWVGYKEYVGDDAAAVTNAAHDRGVRVVPTFQLFDSKAGYPKMTAFLKSTAAQRTFIAQALDLMAARKADGASLDFESVVGLNPLGNDYVRFVKRFQAAMKARFPDATLVNALSVGSNQTIISGLVGVVDREMVMAYNYRWSGSMVTGAIAPLDHAQRNIKIHMARIMQWAPADSLLLGIGYYGYEWPVTSAVPNAAVRTPKATYGGVASVTYAKARDFLAAHPKTVRNYDAVEGSAFYTYWSSKWKSYRQVYFEDEHSVAAKYDYALVTGLGGVGIWTLDNDKGYQELWNVLRDKFYAPVKQMSVKGRVISNVRVGGSVLTRIRLYGRETGTVPQWGEWRWTLRDARGRVIKSGKLKKELFYPNRLKMHTMTVVLGSPGGLRAGTYSLRVSIVTARTTWRSKPVAFVQRY